MINECIICGAIPNVSNDMKTPLQCWSISCISESHYIWFNAKTKQQAVNNWNKFNARKAMA
jgi:hypothetical protein